MKIKKIFNNNAVIAEEPQKGDVVLLGAGLGFYAKPGDTVDENKIERIFYAKENSLLFDLLDQIPNSYLNTTYQIVRYANNVYNMKLNDSIFLALTDHLYFALKRIQEKIDIENPYIMDIQHFYPNEYKVGLYAKEIIKENYSIDISESEICYITMHIIENSNEKKEDLKLILDIMEYMTQYLQKNYLQSVPVDSLSYSRLITHIKFFAKRYSSNSENVKEDKLLDDTIGKAFRQEQKCIKQLSKELESRFGKAISPAEQNYMILHIRNCKNTAS